MENPTTTQFSELQMALRTNTSHLYEDPILFVVYTIHLQ